VLFLDFLLAAAGAQPFFQILQLADELPHTG
jgi:hypothetical protein